jgi:hypothetical protein
MPADTRAELKAAWLALFVAVASVGANPAADGLEDTHGHSGHSGAVAVDAAASAASAVAASTALNTSLEAILDACDLRFAPIGV